MTRTLMIAAAALSLAACATASCSVHLAVQMMMHDGHMMVK